MNTENIAKSFHLSKSQNEKYEAWRKSLPKADYGTTGGGYQFIFIPTSIDTIVTVRRDDGHELDLTEDDLW